MKLLTAVFVFLSAATTPIASVFAVDAMENLKPERLEAVHQSVQSLRSQRTEVPRTGPFQEHRANLHVHSHWSHDSVGTVEEIVVAARSDRERPC